MVPVFCRCLYPKRLVDDEGIESERWSEVEKFLETLGQGVPVGGDNDSMPELFGSPDREVASVGGILATGVLESVKRVSFPV